MSLDVAREAIGSTNARDAVPFDVAREAIGSTNANADSSIDLFDAAIDEAEPAPTDGPIGEADAPTVDAPPRQGDETASCGGYCFLRPASAWQGPVALYASNGAPLGCADAGPLVFEGSAELTGEAHSCGCTCSAPTGERCGDLVVDVFESPDCAGDLPCEKFDVQPDVCEFDNPFCENGVRSMRIRRPTVIDSWAQCAPRPTRTVPTPAWTTKVVACDLDRPGSCNAGRVCSATAPVGGRTCLWSKGEQACPDNFAFRSIYYEKYEDTRDCSACACGPVTGDQCGGRLFAFADPAADTYCNGAAYSYPVKALENGCVPAPATMYQWLASISAGEGSCTPNGGQPVGRVTPQSPVTFCCLEL